MIRLENIIGVVIGTVAVSSLLVYLFSSWDDGTLSDDF